MKITRIHISWCIWVLIATLASSLPAQTRPLPVVTSTATSSTVQTLQFKSKLMAREIPYKVILPPANLGPKQSTPNGYPVIYLLHGLAGHYDNWTTLTKLTAYAAAYGFIIVTPEGGDGWYTDSSTIPNDKYESYIIRELIPDIDKNFRTLADGSHRAIAGLSMGGYGAVKFGLKYPDKFSLVGSFSGALDAPLRGQNSQFLRPSIVSVFGPEGSKTRKDNDIFALIREMTGEHLKGLPFIYLDCGTEDSFFQINRDFESLLVEKSVAHEFRELPGKHEWPYWDSQVQEFLRLADRRLKP
jgi:putative tributyrin esterase